MEKTFFSSGYRDGRSIFFLLGIVILSGVLTACSPAKKYSGPYLPDEKVAVIQTDDKMFTHVEILSIDKNALYIDEDRIAVQPGRHTLFVEAALDYPFLHKHLYFNQYVTFNAEAGQVYTVHANILPMKDVGYSWITSQKNPAKTIIKKYAVGLIRLPTYP